MISNYLHCLIRQKRVINIDDEGKFHTACETTSIMHENKYRIIAISRQFKPLHAHVCILLKLTLVMIIINLVITILNMIYSLY